MRDPFFNRGGVMGSSTFLGPFSLGNLSLGQPLLQLLGKRAGLNHRGTETQRRGVDVRTRCLSVSRVEFIWMSDQLFQDGFERRLDDRLGQ